MRKKSMEETLARKFYILFCMTLGILMLTAALSAGAEKTTTRTLSNEPHTWRPWTCNGLPASDLKLLGFTLSDANAFKTRLQQIADIFRKAPVWNPPMGVYPHLSGSLLGPPAYIPYAKKLKYHPIAGYIMMGSFKHIGGETLFIMIYVNLMPGGGGVNMLSDDEGEFYEDPVRTADIGGFPTYGDKLIIAKNGRPLWTPISRERYLKAFIAKQRPVAANAERYIAEQQKQYEAFVAPAASSARQAKYKAAIDKMASKGAAAAEHERRYWERDEADMLAVLKRGASHDPKDSSVAGLIAGVKAAEEQLAAMPPAERSGPACLLDAWSDPTMNALVAMGTPKCIPLVGKNPNFFDPQLPRSVPQIIVVARFRDLQKTWKKGRPGENKKGPLDFWTTYEAFRQTDWQKVADQVGR